MTQLPGSIILIILVLTAYLIFTVALKFAVTERALRLKLMMTSFFFFIVATLTISFWPYALDTLPYSIPSAFLGILVGHFVGVRAAKRRLETEGLEHYLEHFAHIHTSELQKLTWWTLVNYYSVMVALVLINFVGLSLIIVENTRLWAIITSAIGAFLLGTVAPYLIHVWSIGMRDATRSTRSE